MMIKKRLSYILFCSLCLLSGKGYAQDAEYDANKNAYDAIGASAAYEAGYSGRGVTVAVMDNGVLATHQEFVGQFDPLQGDYDINNESPRSHGTPVAGIVAAKKDGIGMHGVAYNAKILSFPLTIKDSMGKGCSSCYSDRYIWQLLSQSAFDAVKIVNNSFGANDNISSITSEAEFNVAKLLVSSDLSALKKVISTDKLIVASAGNEMQLSPGLSPAGAPYFDSSLKNNIISAIAYDPAKATSDPFFLESYTNLAQRAEAWSLAAPVGGITAPSNEGNAAYDDSFSGTSAAAPVISGAAAVVSSAFPYMSGKQLADVLLSTADKDYTTFSKYMVQKRTSIITGSRVQILFFSAADGYGRNWTKEEKESIVREQTLDDEATCSTEGVSCVDVTYAEVFGQGLLNLESAIKGPAYLDMSRLEANYSDGQYWYSVDTKGYDSTWSHDIGEIWTGSSVNAKAGLIKWGKGALTLSGNNTFTGDSMVKDGTLNLTGVLKGGVIVNGGSFSISNPSAVLNGALTVEATGAAQVNFGTLNKALTNNGTIAIGSVQSANITLNDTVTNNGTAAIGSAQAANITLNNTVINNGTATIGSAQAATVNVNKPLINNGTLTIGSTQAADIKLNDALINNGTAKATQGTIAKNIENNGSFVFSGTQANPFNITASQGAVNKKGVWEFQTGQYSGTFNNQANVKVTGNTEFLAASINNSGMMTIASGATLRGSSVDNKGYLSGTGTIPGTVDNRETGTVDTSLKIGTLNSTGKIGLVMNENGLEAMRVGTLNVTGGKFSLVNSGKPLKEGNYTVINFDSLTSFSGFDSEIMVTGFISAVTERKENAIDLSLNYKSLDSKEYAPSLTENERKTASVVNRLFKENGLKLDGFYYLNEDGLKKEINKIQEGVKPLRFSSLPLSNKMTQGVYTHIFERQMGNVPMRYNRGRGMNQYYSPVSPSLAPKDDRYHFYNQQKAPQQPYRYRAPRKASQPEYRYQEPKKQNGYRRSTGRSGGNDNAISNQVWGQAFMHEGTFKSDKSLGLSDADSSGAGFMFGWDFVSSDSFLWGLTAGYASSSVKQEKDKTDITDLRLGLYFSKQSGPVSIDGALMFGRQDYDKTRMTVLPTDTYKSTASFGGTSVETSLNIGYDILSSPMQKGGWSMRPYVGVTAIQMMQDAYQEKGEGDVNLAVKKSSNTSFMASPGLMLGYAPSNSSFLGYRMDYMFIDARYNYTSGGNSKIKAYFGADTRQETFEVPIGSDKSTFSIGAGINGRITNNTRLNLYFNQQSGPKSSVRSASLSLIYAF